MPTKYIKSVYGKDNPPPPGLSNQYEEEWQFLNFHRCVNEGEVYAASFLITTEHLFKYNTTYSLTLANTELASFLVMEVHKSKKEKAIIGSMMQSLDILDLSVIHLSAFERTIRRYNQTLSEKDSFKLTQVTRDLRNVAISYWADADKRNSHSAKLNATVAILPWLGTEIGVGNSKLTFRLLYLQACFWSIYRHIPRVVIGVKTKRDYKYAKTLAGLPAMDVLLIEDLPHNKALPAALVQQAKALMQKKRPGWLCKYLFFSESDQLLILKNVERAFGFLDQFPRRVLVPHRLIPYPEQVLLMNLSRQISDSRANDWQQMSCCMPRQNCKGSRTGWVRAADRQLNYVRVMGLQLALGNANFRLEEYRPCSLALTGVDICP